MRENVFSKTSVWVSENVKFDADFDSVENFTEKPHKKATR